MNIFAPGLSMPQFCARFLLHDPALVAYKSDRFRRMMSLNASGRLLARPNVAPTWGPAHLTYHSPPMYGVLQGKYEDVEAELNHMRSQHLADLILFVGGDGLSINRVNHLIKDHFELYLDQTPVMIPVAGESPHGVFHCMHAGWRLYLRLIRLAAAELGMGTWLVEDPLVKHFNSHLFFLYKLIRACSDYISIISNTPGALPLDELDGFQRAAERNIDFAWIFHFLHDYGYMVLDFKRSVRSNDGARLDQLWCEFFSLGHTSTANKTQYVPMAIMRVWWSMALNPRVAALYQSIRCIPMSSEEGAMVGWDFPIEDLNCECTVRAPCASESRIEHVISTYSITSHSYRQLRDSFLGGRARQTHHMRAMDADVRILVEWLLESVGRTWQEATRLNPAPSTRRAAPTPRGLGIPRGTAPWDEVQDVMTTRGAGSVPNFIAGHVRNLTGQFYSMGP